MNSVFSVLSCRARMAFAAGAALMLPLTQAAPPSADDLWDVNQGIVIVADSGILGGSDPRDMFGGGFSSIEMNHTLFSDDRPEGFVHFIEWRTAQPVTVRSFRLFAAGDGPEYNHEREFDGFTLKAKSLGSTDFDVVLYSFTPNHPYSLLDETTLELVAVNVAPVTAQVFRAEFVQYNGHRGFDGPRIVELDGFETAFPTIDDGIPDAWRQQFFGPGFASDPRAAAIADPDGDGATNYQEHLAGTHPLDAKSVENVPLTVTTYAGSVAGGQDGYRLESTFTGPAHLAFDPAGRLWVAEATLTGYATAVTGGHRIRRMEKNEVFETIAGSAEPGWVDGPGTLARFAGPNGIVFDRQGNAWVVDRANHRIRKIDSNGVVSTFAGSEAGFRDGTGTEAMFHTPIGLAIDESGHLYVADWENLRIRKITPEGVVSTLTGGVRGASDGSLAEASFDSPNGLAFGPDGTLFVSDWANGSIRKIAGGQVTTFAAGLSYIDGVTVDLEGNVYAALTGAQLLAKFSPDGEPRWTLPLGQGFEDGPVHQAKFSAVTSPPTVRPDGMVLVADWGNNRIRQITTGVPPLLQVAPAPGSETDAVVLTLRTNIGGAIIRYSLRGEEPDASSPVYNGPIQIAGFTTVKAQLFVNNLPVSRVLTAVYNQTCAPAAEGLVAWWPGEGTASDVLGRNPGLLEGTGHDSAGFAPGKVGHGFALDGIDGRIRIPASPALNAGAGPGLTLEAWISPTDLQRQQPIFEWNSGSAYGAHFYLSVIPPYGSGPGCLYANLVDTSGNDHVIASPPGLVKASQFQHAALTYDRASGRAMLYLNGAPVAEENLGQFTPQTGFDLLLGYRPPGFPGSPFAFAGKLDEPALYNRALRREEIEAIFNIGSGGKCKRPNEPLPGLAAHWTFDESGGSVAHDKVGPANGLLSSGASFVQGGISGNALALDRAANGFVNMGQVFELTDTSFSLVAWIKMNPGDIAESSLVIAKHEATFNNGYFLNVNRSGILGQDGKAMFFAGDAFNVPVSQTSVNDGRWHQLVAVHELNGNNLLYVDGVLESTVSSAPVQPSSAPLLVGGASFHSAPLGLFTGSIDEVQIYSRALAPSEVSVLFSGPAPSIPRVPVVSTLAGSGTAAFGDGTGPAASFNGPNGGFVGADQAAYVADTFNHSIRRVDLATGRVTTVAGTGEPGFVDGVPAHLAQFKNPLGVTMGALGTLFVADTGNNRIRVIAKNSLIVTTIAGSGLKGYLDGPAATAQFDYPNDLVTDASGNVYVSEFNNHTIRKISPDGQVSTVVGDGTPGFDNGPREVARLNQPAGLAIDKAGNIYVSEWGSHRIRKISAGEVTTLAGSVFPGFVDGRGVEARFFRPDGMVVDEGGNLFVVEHGNNTLRRISPDGTVVTVAGSALAGHQDGPGSSARFYAPGGLGIDANGRLVIADTGNHRIRLVSFLGLPEILAPPHSRTVAAGSSVEFSVVASGSGPYTHQWKFNGNTIPGAIDAVLVLNNVQFSQAGLYSVVIANPAGSVESASATLTVVRPIEFTRSLPVYYAPGVSFTVRLETQGSAAAGSYAYAVEDSPPEHWVVSGLSTGEGGFYDPVTRKVKFGPFFDFAPRFLTYRVTPPTGESGTRTFRGAVSADGQQLAIGGAATILEPPRHPADLAPADWRLAIDETTGYASAWRQGRTWSVGPNPIRVDYVTRAGFLWKLGEAYRFDPQVPRAPGWWVNQMLAGPFRLQGATSGEPFEAASARRVLPLAFVPGESFVVQVRVQPREAIVYAVEERVPGGSTVAEISHGGAHDSINHLVKWGPFFDNSPRELSFTLTCAPGTQAPLMFAGVASFDGASDPVGGAELMGAAVRLGSLTVLADGEFGLSLGQSDGKAYLIEASTDLQTWSPLVTVIPSGGLLRFKDPAAAEQPQKFYRAVQEPD